MRAALLVLALLVAGCSAQEPGTDAPGAPADGQPPEFSTVALPFECRFSCYEPTLAADAQGRLFVVDGSSSGLARSVDGGATWTQLPLPEPEGLVPGGRGDGLVQAAPSGRLYFSALVVSGMLVPPLHQGGIQVAWSDDAGESWAGNVLLHPTTAPTDAVVSPDRQWLAFGEGGTVYLSYNQIPSGIWVARSDDGGESWGGWTRAATLEDRGGRYGQSGPPVVDAEGRVLVPACVVSPRPGLAVYASGDGGASFQRRDVEGSGSCSWFPILAPAADGSLVAAWVDDGDAVRVSASTDGGASWSAPAEWGSGAAVSPWPFPRPDGGLAVAWIEGSTLRLALGSPAGGPSSTLTVAENVAGGANGANTDFAHGALLPDGKLALAWSNAEEKKVFVARET